MRHFRHGLESLNLPEVLRNGTLLATVLPDVDNPFAIIQNWAANRPKRTVNINTYVEPDRRSTEFIINDGKIYYSSLKINEM